MGAIRFTHQPFVPVRAGASDAAEMVTQLLFGDLCEILETERQWQRVRILDDGYEGWIDEKMTLPTPPGWAGRVDRWQYVAAPALSLTARRHGDAYPLHLGLGCRIPAPRENGRRDTLRIDGWELELPHGEIAQNTMPGGLNVMEVSRYYLGAPYLWGGKSLWGIDCSGFTQIVFAVCGMRLPRDASQQALEGRDISFGAHRQGDLAFFDNARGKVTHVGILLENGMIRHANGNVHDDYFTDKGIKGKYSGRQSHALCRIKRIH